MEKASNNCPLPAILHEDLEEKAQQLRSEFDYWGSQGGASEDVYTELIDRQDEIDRQQIEQQKWERILSHCEYIVNAAREYDINPALIASIMFQESSVTDPKEISDDGAVGFMQVMPRDTGVYWECINGDCFEDRPTTEELYDIQYNIRWGAKILRDKINAWGSETEGVFHYGPKDWPREEYTDLIMARYNKIKVLN